MRLFTLVVCWGWITLSFGQYFQLVLIHTNDIQGRIDQTNKYGATCSQQDEADDKCYGGVARMQTKVQEIRKKYPYNSLFLDSGQRLRGTVWSSYYEGLVNAFFMNILGYDIMTLGHYEFDYGLPKLRRFIDDLKFPVVLSNMDPGNSIIRNTYVTSHTFLVNGEKVGVVGYITRRITKIQEPEYLEGLSFSDEVEAVRREAVKLESEGVAIIIAIGHFGYPVDFKVANEVEQVDIVVGGSSNLFFYNGDPPSNEEPAGDYPKVITRPSGKKVLVVNAFAFGKYLGFLKVNFTIDGLNLHSWEGQPILLDASIPEDSEVKDLIGEWNEPVVSFTNTTIGSSHVRLEGDNVIYPPVCRTRECSLGNVFTDAVLWSYVKSRPATDTQWSDVGIAVWNSGAIRASIEQGPISLDEVLASLPFRDPIALVEVSRCVLVEMLEHSVSQIEPAPGFFLQMSGIRVKYNMSKPVGERVVSVLVRCTECIVPKFVPLEECGVYKVLISSYVANGGDGYSMIPKKGRIDIGPLEAEALTEYIRQFSPIITGLEGRIEYVKNDPIPTPSPPPVPAPSPGPTPLQVLPCSGNQQNLPKGIVIMSTNGLCIT